MTDPQRPETTEPTDDELYDGLFGPEADQVLTEDESALYAELFGA